MKNRKTKTRDLLGMSQMETAALLRVSRAQWSMFESGRRLLPLEAFITWIAIEKAVARIQKKLVGSAFIPPKFSEKKRRRLWEQNQFSTTVLMRKIEAAEKKLHIGQKLSLMPGLLESNEAQNQLSSFFTRKSIMTSDDKLADELAEMYHQLHLLEYERKLLEVKSESQK